MDKQPIVKHYSPLRYPGSKKKLAHYLYKIIQHNKISTTVLVEPFVGGGNVALNFLANNIVDRVVIADKDKLIYSFWREVFFNPQHLISFVRKVKISLSIFHKYKNIAINSHRYSSSVLSKACLFLNRTSFSGILTNQAGPLGGIKQKSSYKIDCRFNKKNIIDKIKFISSFKSKVTVLPYDWVQTIEYLKEWRKRKNISANKILFYFDPPFFNKAPHLYRSYFSNINHSEFCSAIKGLKYNWILSYDNAPEIKKLYSGNNNCLKMHINMPYSINSHSKRLEKELIITPLSLPKAATLERH